MQDSAKKPQCFVHPYVPLENFMELAQHVLKDRKGHPRKSVVWAEKFSMNVEFLNQKKDIPTRTPMSEETKSHFEDIKRELSGEEHVTMCVCTCGKSHAEVLPVEYIESNSAWRKNGRIITLCESCRVKGSRNFARIY